MTEEAAYFALPDGGFRATPLTQGPWSPAHQHAGPPSALIARAVEVLAASHGLDHVGRVTVNLLRPLPIGECRIEVAADHVGRNAGHFSGRLGAEGKTVALFTALAQREHAFDLPAGTPGHPPPFMPQPPAESAPATMAQSIDFGYARLVENRVAAGVFFAGPCAAWFRLRRPLVSGESPSPYVRAIVAADSGNGISAVLSFATHSFVNCDLTVNLLRRPRGEWIGLDARTWLGRNGCGLTESALYDEDGLIGRATQNLAVRAR